MTRERALEIIGAYGADAARWPAAERASVLALAAQDSQVATARAEARSLDALLDGWAADVPLRQFDPQALIPARTIATPHRPLLRWVGGGAVAAALAMALVLTVPGTTPAPQTVTASNMSPESPLESASDSSEPLDGFALIFTPTADEEELI